MCGIIGITGNFKKKEIDTDAMLASLSKRGPDDKGLLQFDLCILGQTRLSIIDLSGGHQPMKDNTKNIAITFNGEIYNYLELKKDLEAKGHTFSTASDTEVILKAYAEYGTECVTHLDGMFAFALWDDEEELLFLARDRFGEKPLYYAESDDKKNFICASEIKSILQAKLVKPELDPIAIDNYLTLLCVPPWKSLYKNIQTLPPAHTLIYKNGIITKKQYWKLKKNPLNISWEDARITLKKLLSESVTSRMIADVPVGTFLSGGVDSSIITYIAQSISKNKIKSFSAGFEDFINELPFAEEVAKIAGTDHNPIEIKTDLLQSFKDVTTYFDEPFGDSSNIPMHLISEFARTQVKVVLSGDGGDELFLGYGQYRKHMNLPKLKLIWNKIFSNPFELYKKNIQVFSVKDRTLLWKDSRNIEKDPFIHADLSEAQTHIEKINIADISIILPADMLTKVDRGSMMHSLEVRSPFLDHKLAEFAYNLPQNFKVSKTQGKIILKDIFKDILPDHILYRKKQGFGAPVKDWLKRPDFQEYIDKNIIETSRMSAFFNMDYVRSLFKSKYGKDEKLQYKLWALLSLEEWLRTHEN